MPSLASLVAVRHTSRDWRALLVSLCLHLGLVALAAWYVISQVGPSDPVVDVTGQLGGYNFQWAWSSAVAAGRAL